MCHMQERSINDNMHGRLFLQFKKLSRDSNINKFYLTNLDI